MLYCTPIVLYGRSRFEPRRPHTCRPATTHSASLVSQFYKFNSINKGYISIQDMYNIRKMFFNSLDALVEAHSVDFRGFDLFRFYSDR